MITCKKATELISRKMDGKLSVTEKIRLFAHLCICHFCRSFQDHVRTIHSAMSSIKQKESIPRDRDASAKLKERIIESIRRQG